MKYMNPIKYFGKLEFDRIYEEARNNGYTHIEALRYIVQRTKKEISPEKERRRDDDSILSMLEFLVKNPFSSFNTSSD